MKDFPIYQDSQNLNGLTCQMTVCSIRVFTSKFNFSGVCTYNGNYAYML